MKTIKALLITFVFLVAGMSVSNAQPVAPTGIQTRAATQLVYYYDQADEDSQIQVTNINDTEGTWIHVQIFRSFDANDASNMVTPVLCDERDFVDFLTPNDTHFYSLANPSFPKNEGESEQAVGESTSIDVTGTKGFIVITPVVSEADFTAISFQYMIGTTYDDGYDFIMNAMGRDAINFTTGEIAPDGTPLDGVSNGLVVVQPEELVFDFAGDESDVNVVGFAFQDNYGPAGLLGYNVIPASANWTSFIFDFKEDPTSCGNRIVDCFLTLGLNESFQQDNDEFTPGSIPDDLLCGGSETPEFDLDGNTNAGNSSATIFYGWTRIFISGLEPFVNHIGVFTNDETEGADFMFVRGERTEFEPEPMDEICDDEAMADEDEDGFANCLDSDCATAENCETGEEQCADEVDNDEDGQTDCADLGCDGFAGCEFGEEVSCDDGIDNDADGAVDGDDTDCQVADTGGDGGDGGGCVVTGTVSTTSSVVNFLVLMLPFIGVFGIRRFRNKVLGR